MPAPRHGGAQNASFSCSHQLCISGRLYVLLPLLPRSAVYLASHDDHHVAVDQVNYNLFAVNIFMAGTGLYQLSRKLQYDFGTPKLPEVESTPAVPQK